MTKPKRLARYFEIVGPNHLVTHQEIIDLLWRCDPDGGPENTSLNIRQQINRVKKLLPQYTFKAERRWGYRMTE